MHRFGEEKEEEEHTTSRLDPCSCIDLRGLAAYYGNFTVRRLFLRFEGAALISLGIKIIIISRPSPENCRRCLSFSRYVRASIHSPPGGQIVLVKRSRSRSRLRERFVFIATAIGKVEEKRVLRTMLEIHGNRFAGIHLPVAMDCEAISARRRRI